MMGLSVVPVGLGYHKLVLWWWSEFCLLVGVVCRKRGGCGRIGRICISGGNVSSHFPDGESVFNVVKMAREEGRDKDSAGL